MTLCLSIKEAANELRISEDLAKDLVADGTIPSIVLRSEKSASGRGRRVILYDDLKAALTRISTRKPGF